MAISNEREKEMVWVEVLQQTEINGTVYNAGDKLQVPARKLNRLVEADLVKKSAPPAGVDQGYVVGATLASVEAPDRPKRAETIVKGQPAADKPAQE